MVIGHRGACKRAPENTMAAFRLAAETGADAIEFDVKLTADGHVVVMHDQTLDRTTNGSGPVHASTLAEIKRLDAGAHFSESYAGETVPTLDEVLDELGEQLLLNIEMTNYARLWDRLPESVVRLVRERRLQDRVLLSSFNPIALLKAARIAPEIPRGLLVMPSEPRPVRAGLARVVRREALNPHDALVNARMIRTEHGKKRHVYVWTVNDGGRARELLTMGVDGIITDVPDVIRAKVDAWVESRDGEQ